MYVGSLRDPEAEKRIREVCNAFGIDYDSKNII
jgi:hypothetical protein